MADHPTPSQKHRWLIAVSSLPLVVAGWYFGLREPAEPLSFNCGQPAQQVVEDVLNLSVDRSVGVGDSDSATAYWESEGRKAVLVTCTSVTPSERAVRTPRSGEPGFVSGELDFLLTGTSSPDFESALHFTYDDAVVRIETINSVDEEEARRLVASWVDSVRAFDELYGDRFDGHLP